MLSSTMFIIKKIKLKMNKTINGHTVSYNWWPNSRCGYCCCLLRVINLFLLIMLLLLIMIDNSEQASLFRNHLNNNENLKFVPKKSHHKSLKSLSMKSSINNMNNNKMNHYFDHNFFINVKNNGGEIFHESIRTNLFENFIQIDFEETDGGTHIRQILDFKNNIQIFRIQRLGEQDLNQEQQLQSFCFVTRLSTLNTKKKQFKDQIKSKNDLNNHEKQLKLSDHNSNQQLINGGDNSNEDDMMDKDGDYGHGQDNNGGGSQDINGQAVMNHDLNNDINHNDNGDGDTNKDNYDNDDTNNKDDNNDNGDGNGDDDDDYFDFTGYVSPQIMARLSQKNPSTIRYADDDRGQQTYHMDLEIVIDNNNNGDGRNNQDIDDDNSNHHIDENYYNHHHRYHHRIPIISKHINNNCDINNAGDRVTGGADYSDDNRSIFTHIYGSYDDLRLWNDGHRAFANISNAIRMLNRTITMKNDGHGKSTKNLPTTMATATNNVDTNSKPDDHKLRCDQIITNYLLSSSSTMKQQQSNNNNDNGQQSIMNNENVNNLLLSLSSSSSSTTTLNTSKSIIKTMFNKIQSCYCSMNILIPWYVCGIRYCPMIINDRSSSNNNNDNDNDSHHQQQQQYNGKYRCGVRTCRKSYQFVFPVNNLQRCLTNF